MIIVEGIDYFLIPAENPEVSAKFYSDIFDFESVNEKIRRIRRDGIGLNQY